MPRLLPASIFSLLLSLSFILLVSACDEEGQLADDDDTAASPDDDDDDASSDDDDSVEATFPESVSFETTDGLTIQGTFQAAPGVVSGPVVILLHELGTDRHDYDQIWPLFHPEGLATLAIDFRSHGASDSAGVDMNMLPDTPEQLSRDLEGALAWLAQRPEVDPTRIGVMGLSMGANVALLGNHQREDSGVASTIAFSPSESSVASLVGTSELSFQSVLYVASENDSAAAQSAQALMDRTEEPKTLQLVQGTSSAGSALLSASADARAGSVAWFVEHL